MSEGGTVTDIKKQPILLTGIRDQLVSKIDETLKENLPLIEKSLIESNGKLAAVLKIPISFTPKAGGEIELTVKPKVELPRSGVIWPLHINEPEAIDGEAQRKQLVLFPDDL